MVLSAPKPIVSGHPSSWHWEKFAEFVRFKAEVGEPSPHMTVVGWLSRDCSIEEKVWRAGCYAAPYSVITAEILWTEWPLTRMQSSSEDFLPWVREHWHGLHTRTERRCVRTPEKFARCLIDYAQWMPELRRLWNSIAANGTPAREAYDLLWDSASSVDFFGRYITIRLLELLKRYAGLPAELYDIRSIGGWSPIRALCLFFPEHTANLLGPESVRWTDGLATKMLKRLGVSPYVLAAMLCEYRVAYEDRRQYPARTQDQELEYYNKFAPRWPDFPFRLLEARDALFPPECLGEVSGWEGIRPQLGRTLRDHEYNWNDLRYDFSATTDLTRPSRRGAPAANEGATTSREEDLPEVPRLVDLAEHVLYVMRRNKMAEANDTDGLHFELLPCDAAVYEDNIVKKQHLRHTTIEPDEVWMDIGAYIGTFALLAAHHGAKVVAFEPCEPTRTRLKEHVAVNDYVSQVRVSPRAVMLEAGEVPLYLNGDSNPAANSTFNRWKRAHETETVAAVTLPEAIALARRAFPDGTLCAKLDIEGAEIPILEQADFSEFSKLIVEYHFHADSRISRLHSIVERLEGQGFHITLEHPLPDRMEWPNPRKQFITFWAQRNGASTGEGETGAGSNHGETGQTSSMGSLPSPAAAPVRTRAAITEVFPGLYQRGHMLTWPLERKKSALTSLNIDVVVNLWNKVDPDMSSVLKGLIYLNWPIDGDAVPPDLEDMTNMISSLLSKGRHILVHCEAGANRSAFLCAVVIARMRGCSGTEALEVVRAAQPRAKLNRNLQRYIELELT